MKLINITGGELNSTILSLSEALGEGGDKVAFSLRTDPGYLERVASYMLRGAPSETPAGAITVEIARAIMGNDRVFGPAEVARVVGTHIDPADLVKANQVPYKLETLVRAKPNYILVYGLPTNIDQIVLWSATCFRWLYPEGDRTSFTTDTPVQGWYLVCREPVGGAPDDVVDRHATLVEIFLALMLHKSVSPRHNFFLAKGGWCQQTKGGGEVFFCFGNIATGQQYGTGSHDYWAIKGPTSLTAARGRTDYVRVILPDDPIK